MHPQEVQPVPLLSPCSVLGQILPLQLNMGWVSLVKREATGSAGGGCSGAPTGVCGVGHLAKVGGREGSGQSKTNDDVHSCLEAGAEAEVSFCRDRQG